MAVAKFGVHVEGLAELSTELKAVDKAWPKELRLANKEAADIVAKATAASFASRGGVAPKVAASVKTLATQRGSSVRIGGNKAPFAMGSEFGSVRYLQFPAWKGSGGDAGYSLYPSLRDKQPEVMAAYGHAIDRLTKAAFPS